MLYFIYTYLISSLLDPRLVDPGPSLIYVGAYNHYRLETETQNVFKPFASSNFCGPIFYPNYPVTFLTIHTGSSKSSNAANKPRWKIRIVQAW